MPAFRQLAGLTPHTIAVFGGLKDHVREVKTGAFPDDDHSYKVDQAEFDKFATMVDRWLQF